MGPLPAPNGVVPPMPYPGPAGGTVDRAAPPMPSEVTSEHAHAAGGRFRAAMQKMIHRTPR
jgi:hypothetical protein